MKSFWHLRLSVLTVLFLCLVVVLASCSKKDVKMEEPLMTPSEGLEAPAAGAGGSETLGSAAGDASTFPAGELEIIYFDYDKYSIRSDARAALKANAKWLKKNSSVSVQVEGHCDERGTTEYNLALGESRAKSVKEYLSRLGVSSSRLSTVSYGEERPQDAGQNESAWARNRRAVFVIVSK